MSAECHFRGIMAQTPQALAGRDEGRRTVAAIALAAVLFSVPEGVIVADGIGEDAVWMNYQNETRHMRVVPDVSVAEPTIHDGLSKGWNGKIRNGAAMVSRLVSVGSYSHPTIDWGRGDIIKLTKPNPDLDQDRRRFPIIINLQLENSPILVALASTRNVSPLDFATMFQLAAIDCPDRCSEQRDGPRRESGDGRGDRVKKFSDLPEREQRHVIGGAFFVACMLGLLTILYIRGNPS